MILAVKKKKRKKKREEKHYTTSFFNYRIGVSSDFCQQTTIGYGITEECKHLETYSTNAAGLHK